MIVFIISATLSAGAALSGAETETPSPEQEYTGSANKQAPSESLPSERNLPAVTEKEKELLEKVREQAESNVTKAITMLEQEIDTAASAALPYTLGTFLLKQEKYSKAAESFRDALKRAPDFRQARQVLADALLQAQNYAEAAAEYRQIIDAASDRKDHYWSRLGFAYLRQQKFAAAETAYRNALVRNPDERTVRQGLLQSLLEQERRRQARPLIREELTHDPARTNLWQLLADEQLALGNRHNALVLLTCARRLTDAPDDKLLLSCADLYLEQNIPDAAFRAYSEAAEIKSADSNTQRLLNAAQAFIARGHPQKGADLLRKLKNDACTNEQAARKWYLQSRAVQKLDKDSDDIKRCLEKALQHDPLHGPALLRLGRLHIDTGRLTHAKATFNRATRISDTKAKALIGLAQVAAERNDYAQAVRHLEESVELDPNPNVRRYLQSMKEQVE